MARVGIDLDGVVVDFVDSYRRHVPQFRPDLPKEMPEPTHWEFYKDPEWGSRETEQFLRCLADCHSIFIDAKPYPGAEQALVRLLDAGHTLVFITDRSINPRAYEITREWFHRELPDVWEFRNGIEIHITADKASIDVDYFIDDKPENVRAMLAKCDVKAFLCVRPWNEDADDLDELALTLNGFVEHVLTIEGMEKLTRLMSEPSVFKSSNGEVRVTSPTGGQKGQKLARFDLIPAEALWKVAELYGKGAEKYADWNWRKGYPFSLSVAALERHLNLWKRGQSYDEETSCHHLAAVVFHAMSLMTFEEECPQYDNRYFATVENEEEDVA